MRKAGPKAILFDVFGTVVDWRRGVAASCADVFQEKSISIVAEDFARLWRAEYQPSMTPIRKGDRPYVPLDILHRENLDRILDQLGLSSAFDDEERLALCCAWEKLPPWPDSSTGLKRLRKGYLVAPCSNGSVALMSRLARFANLSWDAILGADIAGQYKPHSDVYLRSAELLGLEPSHVMMAAAHNDDLHAARQLGFQTAFICRPTEHGPDQQTDLEPTQNWDQCVDSIEELAKSLDV